MNITVTDQPDKSHVETVLAGLIEYNRSVTPNDHRELGVFAFEQGRLIAGAYGFSGFDWMHVRYLWVAETHRRRGIGRQLMQAVETEARRRGCRGIHLDTYSFQALPFYQKEGFSIFGTIADHPRGSSRYYLKKDLA